MKLITKAEIIRFRSIREATLDKLGHFSGLAGLNNAGKSNFLRALNAFFNNETDFGISVRVDTDYYRPEMQAKRRKVIKISLTFDLPAAFKFRPDLKKTEALLGGRSFVVSKSWERDANTPSISLNDQALSLEEQGEVSKFLNLISFRYIPNRVIPTEIIRREQQALRDVLIRRLAKLKKQATQLFDGLRETADSLIGEVSDEIAKMAPGVSGVRLATATSLADLAFRFGYRLSESNAEMEEAEQGSGIQSLLMLQTLHLIDRDYFQKFGWKQAAIWGVEEPESSLHTALEAQVAQFLAKISRDPKGRLQIVASTHSDLMMQYADSGYYVKKTPDPVRCGTIAVPKEPRQLVAESAKFGVSRWVNPILYYPIDSLVLVEGKTDRDFMLEGLRILGWQRAYRIECLEDLTGTVGKGGDDTLKKFIKDNVDAILARPTGAPVVIVLDWESKTKVQDFSAVVKDPSRYVVTCWDEREANPSLDDSFRGIERFYSDRIVLDSGKEAESLLAKKSNGQWTIPRGSADKLKSILAKTVQRGLVVEDIRFASPFLRRLHQVAGGLASISDLPRIKRSRGRLSLLDVAKRKNQRGSTAQSLELAATRARVSASGGELYGKRLEEALRNAVDYVAALNTFSERADLRILDALVRVARFVPDELRNLERLNRGVELMHGYLEATFPDACVGLGVVRRDGAVFGEKVLVFKTTLNGVERQTVIDCALLLSSEYGRLLLFADKVSVFGFAPYVVKMAGQEFVAPNLQGLLDAVLGDA